MFRFIAAVLVLIGVGVSQSSAAVAPTTQVDAEWVARAYLAKGSVADYYGSFDYQRQESPDGPKDFVSGTFRFSRSLDRIVELRINGVQIPIAVNDSQRGLPIEPDGVLVSDYFVYVSGRSVDGMPAEFGYLYFERLLPDTRLVFTARPEWQPVRVYYQADGPNDNLRLRMWTDEGHRSEGWRWNEDIGAFEVWVDPLRKDVWYEVYDARTGMVYATGKLNYINARPSPPQHLLGFQHEAGVVRLPLPEKQWVYYENVQLDCWLEGDSAALVPGKVYFVHAAGKSVSVGLSGIKGRVSISSCEPGAEPVVLVRRGSDGNGDIWCTAAGDRLMITVVGEPMAGRQIDAYFGAY
jgi:hypothetical protein